MGQVWTNIAQVWVNDTNTGGLGHVLPWLVSTYERLGEQEAHTLVGVVQHSSGRILDGYYEGDIGKEHGCMSRSSKMLLIRHCGGFSWKIGFSRLQHVTLLFWPQEG